jgi:hypothetical protein
MNPADLLRNIIGGSTSHSPDLVLALKEKEAQIELLEQKLSTYQDAMDYFTEVHKYARQKIEGRPNTKGIYMWDLLIQTINEQEVQP